MGFLNFFEPGWKSKDENKALKFVEKENNQDVLFNIALAAPLCAVCFAAIAKITDQELLADIVKSGTDFAIRDSALKRITHLDILKDLEVECGSKLHRDHSSSNKRMRDSIVQRRADLVNELDQKEIARLAAGDMNFLVRLRAVKHLLNQSVLADRAINEPNETIRATAVSKLTDQSLLVDIAQSKDCVFIRSRAASIVAEKTADPRLRDRMNQLVKKLNEQTKEDEEYEERSRTDIYK